VTSDNEGDDFSRGGMRRRRGRSRDSHDRHYDYDRNPGRFHHDSYEDGPHRYDGRRQNISRYDRHYDELTATKAERECGKCGKISGGIGQRHAIWMPILGEAML